MVAALHAMCEWVSIALHTDWDVLRAQCELGFRVPYVLPVLRYIQVCKHCLINKSVQNLMLDFFYSVGSQL